MISFLKSLPYKPLIESSKISSTYMRLRMQVFLSIFLGYAAYYLVRKNVGLAAPYLESQLGFSKAEIGWIGGATAISYGLSKFFMGSVSDRSNARWFLGIGLTLSAGVMLMLGTVPVLTSSVAIMWLAVFASGWVQGMGWPPCGRAMTFWWPARDRGKVVSVWNVAHNVGGGLVGTLSAWGVAYFNDWHAIFYVPAGAAIGVAVFVFLMMRDTPRSEGLPDAEHFHNDYAHKKLIYIIGVVATIVLWMIFYALGLKAKLYLPLGLAGGVLTMLTTLLFLKDKDSSGLSKEFKDSQEPNQSYDSGSERVAFSAREIFFEHVLSNKVLWSIAFANVFVYFVRYAALDWATSYLSQVKGIEFSKSATYYAFYEYAAIVGTIACGLLSDYLFKGKRGLTGMFFMLLTLGSVYIYWMAESQFWVITALVLVGGLIYGPVMLIGLHALELVDKKAAGTAAGFTGLFGYMGGALTAGPLAGYLIDHFGWNAYFYAMIAACLLAILALVMPVISEFRKFKIAS